MILLLSSCASVIAVTDEATSLAAQKLSLTYFKCQSLAAFKYYEMSLISLPCVYDSCWADLLL